MIGTILHLLGFRRYRGRWISPFRLNQMIDEAAVSSLPEVHRAGAELAELKFKKRK